MLLALGLLEVVPQQNVLKFLLVLAPQDAGLSRGEAAGAAEHTEANWELDAKEVPWSNCRFRRVTCHVPHQSHIR